MRYERPVVVFPQTSGLNILLLTDKSPLMGMTKFQSSVKEYIQRIIWEHRSMFDEIGLTPELLEPRSYGSGASFNSEVTNLFWDSSRLTQGKRYIVDVVEFHTIQNDLPAISLSELESWLPAVLEDVIDQRRKELRSH